MKSEFELFLTQKIIPILNEINLYLAIDTDSLINESYRTKMLFTKNVVRFFMNSLPYTYLKEMFSKEDIGGLHDALDLLNNEIKPKLLTSISNNKDQYLNFNNLMGNIESSITNDKKKVKFNDMLSLLDQNMSNRLKLLNYYESIIENSGEEDLKKICRIYLQNDVKNIL